MEYIKLFDNFFNDRVLIIVDVQKSFKDYFTDNYLKELNHYCNEFNVVYQIFDNHVDGVPYDKDFLYKKSHEVENTEDLYKFPNQVDIIEKRYNYGVDAEYYKNILSIDTYNQIKSKKLKRGDFFKTTEGTIIVYIGNNHNWMHLPKKLYDVFNGLRGKEIVMVGGAENECLEDLIVSAKAIGLKILKNERFIYSAKKCNIR